MAKAKRKTRNTKSRTAKKGLTRRKASRTRKVSPTKRPSRTRKATSRTTRKGGLEAQSPGRSTANNELIEKPDKIFR
jgi:hypothetical protein